MAQTILVVDDAPEVRAMVRIAVGHEESLTLAGEADTGASAVEAASRLQPRVVVLDLSLPDITGREAFTGVRRAAPGCRIVVYAGDDSDRRWYESRGAVFLAKDNTIEDLLAAVRPREHGLQN